ncbi:DUF2606 family protein [Bacillus thuringiensis]|uniref:DUF2606 domain-containing protein n=1 Tax=Bacillus cereus TaxID=1396 RepID=A0A9X6UKC9_BACCE|nr:MULTISPECIES: DUF2606 family protein [Bacillus]KAB2374513.1 DUF2606 family protein [Bacillus sp. RM2(2019)]KXY54840.1 hypothetical protein AT261_12390 [Bacillus cereus]MED1900184.1 DUF2606 family protein [Bacillus thuringiensis]MED3350252.1 DUF2606 family protein [Bacillus thuringiensis]MEE3961482.1 DUF2606 family protein [Bacillus thuringiensis]
MCLIILKNGLNKYSNSIWILYCILVIIMMSSYIANNEENVSKVVNPITFCVQNKEKQQIKDFEIMLIKDESPQPSKEIVISIGRTNQEGKLIWKTPRKGKYIILLPNNEKKEIVINDRNVVELIMINVN